jgi:Sec-independent protein secretion pathway component TatC
MILIMIPLVILYEASIVIARRFGRPPGDATVKPEVSTGEAGS